MTEIVFGFLNRRQFNSIVRTQMDLFASEYADTVEAARATLRTYDRTSEEDGAMRAYARFDELTAELEDALYDMRDAYQATLSEGRVNDYRRTFRSFAMRYYRDVLPHTAFGDLHDDWH